VQDAFAYLQANNLTLNGGLPENILDDCEILLAATEPAEATGKASYRSVAKARAQSLADRLAPGTGIRTTGTPTAPEGRSSTPATPDCPSSAS
jgi:hypothetical protein